MSGTRTVTPQDQHRRAALEASLRRYIAEQAQTLPTPPPTSRKTKAKIRRRATA